MKEKIGIKRLDHVCWAVRKLDDAMPLLTELMGMKVVGRWQSDEQGSRGVSLEVPGGNVHFELLEPLGGDSFLHRFLEERGPGLHHVTFEVESVEKATQALKEYGYEPFAGRTYDSYKEIYIHPRDTGGVLIQLYEGNWEE